MAYMQKPESSMGPWPLLLLAIICSFLLPSAGHTLGRSGTDPAVGCSLSQGETSSSADLPQFCADFGYMPPDLDWSYVKTVQGVREQPQYPSNHTGPFQTISGWTWPNWTCSPLQCHLQIYLPSWQVVRQDILHLLKVWDLLTIYQRCSELLTRTPGYILRFAGETLILVATLIEHVLVYWNLWLYSVLLYVVQALPGRFLLYMGALSIVSWVWPKKTASYLVQLTTTPLITIRYLNSTGIALISLCLAWTWNTLMTWSLMPWVMIVKVMRTLMIISRFFVRERGSKKKKVSSKSYKAKLKVARSVQRKKGSQKKTPVEERTIPGVQIKKLREDPPKGVILRCTDQFGDHVGYASAVKLEKGLTGIVLPIHVWADSVFITGPNGKMKMADFSALYECIPHDSLIMTSAVNGWGSKLGVRPRPLATIEAVKLKNYSLFTERDGKWLVQAAKLIAPAEGMFRVVSETAPGDSGLPLFDMKMNVVAVHRGTWPAEKFPENRAFAILPVPDLKTPSSPKFTGCETFSETESAYDMAEGFSDGEEVVVKTKGKAYKTFIGLNRVATLSETALREELSRGPIGVWADIEDDESAPKRSGNWTKPVDSGETKSCEEDLSKGRGVSSTLPRPCKRRGRKAKAPQAVRNDPRTEESRQPKEEEVKSCQEDSNPKEDPGQGTYTVPSGRISREGCQSSPYSAATKISSIFEGFYRWKEPREEAPGFNAVGSCPFTVYKCPPKGLSRWGERVARASSFLQACTEKYSWPETGAEAELSSLRYQAARRQSAQTTAVIPPKDVREDLIKRTTEAYRSTALPAPMWAHNFDESHMRFEFWECVRKLKGQAGSGVPYAAFSNRRTNDKWVFDHESTEDLWETVRDRLFRLLNGEFIDPVQAVKDGLVDPIRLFVKLEPHKMEKIRNKRYRLIASVSIVDQLVARMLFREQNEEELLQHMAIPSKPGLGFSQDRQVLAFTESVAALAGTTADDLVENWSRYLTPTDCSGFDWSVPMWLLEDDLAVRNELTLGLPYGLRKMRETWLKCLGQSVFCLSNGLLLAQTSPGIQKSGSFNTSSTNSRMRYMLALYAGADWAVTMGDDALESVNSDLSQYARLGIKCERAEEFDFCSHLFRAPDVIIPKNLEKMVYGLLSGTSPESPLLADRFCWLASLQSILEEMRHMPQEFVDMLIEHLGVGHLVE
ncbi:RNA-dependent RNA polymerase [Enamovirus AEV]|uniref:RNA-dependent RNA polymerase n=1 Tax=Enamovirus AEV TaxID=1770265 RepID=A0A166J1Q2_9VIRU|nr:RNA-dependent RNA polymerase [Alfalfa enamovirus 1]